MENTEIRLHSYCYENPNNTEKLYREVIIEKFNPETLLKLSDLLSSQGRVFRGQADEKQELKTKFERFLEYNSVSLNTDDARTIGKIINIEKNSVKEFQRSVNLHEKSYQTDPIKEKDNYIEWFSFMGHHGGKTRLLDVTKKFFIGLYFAVKDLSDKDAALWCFDKTSLLFDKAKNGNNNSEFSGETFDDSESSYINRLIRNGLNDTQGLIFYEPFFRNEKMNIQESSFILPLNVNRSFESNLIFELFNGKENKSFLTRLEYLTGEKTYYGLKSSDFATQITDSKVLKIVIDKSIKKEILNFLDSFNINEKNLFPDIKGAAYYASVAALNAETLGEQNQKIDEVKLIEIERNVQNLQNTYYKEKSKEKKNEVIEKIYKTIPDMSGLYKKERSPEKSLSYYKFLLEQFKELDAVESLVYLKERSSKLLAEEITTSVRDLCLEMNDLKEAYKYALENYLLCVNLYGQYDYKTGTSKEKVIEIEAALEKLGEQVEPEEDEDDSSWVFLGHQQ